MKNRQRLFDDNLLIMRCHEFYRKDHGLQCAGVMQISIRTDDPSAYTPMPAYIGIANSQVQACDKTYRFTAENGISANCHGFAAYIYARSVQHPIIRNNVLTNCGQAFYS
jgi:hypothetical protein